MGWGAAADANTRSSDILAGMTDVAQKQSSATVHHLAKDILRSAGHSPPENAAPLVDPRLAPRSGSAGQTNEERAKTRADEDDRMPQDAL